MKIHDWSQFNQKQKSQFLGRPAVQQTLASEVDIIIQKVRTEGDEALISLARQYDGLGRDPLKISTEEMEKAWSEISEELRQAIQRAGQNIKKFHSQQVPKKVSCEVEPGIHCHQQPVSISDVGLYIPGGSAPLFSTLLMLALPAQIARCERIVIMTPSRAKETLAAAWFCGIREMYACGGAQAIAALTYGTETIRPVYKIFGPGNSWVTEAKIQVSRHVAIDMLAGPSEVLVIADDSAKVEFVAWDLLSQAEHGPDSQVLLVSPSLDLIASVVEKLDSLIPEIERKTLVQETLSNSLFIKTSSLDEAVEVSNLYAPEHLIIQCENQNNVAEQIKNAGSVFVGTYSPESCGDYASGTNHVLPTAGAARASSGVSLLSFYKFITFQNLSQEGIRNLAPTIIAMAQAEGLECHAQAAKVRLDSL